MGAGWEEFLRRRAKLAVRTRAAENPNYLGIQQGRLKSETTTSPVAAQDRLSKSSGMFKRVTAKKTVTDQEMVEMVEQQLAFHEKNVDELGMKELKLLVRARGGQFCDDE